MIELRSHQRDALARMHDGCVLYGDVGTGKTVTALQYYLDNHGDKDILVITTARKRDSYDWQNEARLLDVDFEKITVDSWNNLKNYELVQDTFVILDEQRLVGTGAWVKAFYKISSHNPWIMLSATPGDVWADYAPVFIANGFYKNITDFRSQHVVYKRFVKYPQIDKYVGTKKLERLRREVLVEMPAWKPTVRHIQFVSVEYSQEATHTAFRKRWNELENRPIRDAAELFRIGRRIVGTDISRVYALENLLKEYPKIIVFYNYDYELEILRGFDQLTTVAEYNGHKHQDIPDADRWLYLVQYNSGAEAWNCTETNVMVFWSLSYSYKHFVQAQGRIDRMNTPFKDLWYYVFMSDSIVDRGVWRSLKRKENFNMNAFVKNW